MRYNRLWGNSGVLRVNYKCPGFLSKSLMTSEHKLQVDHIDKPEVVHDDVQSDASSIKDDVAKVILQDAKDASKDEHETSFREALKLHKKAVFWAVVMSLTIVMEVCKLLEWGVFKDFTWKIYKTLNFIAPPGT